MPCDFKPTVTQETKDRALADLEKKLRSGDVRALLDSQGNVTRFANWDRDSRQGWCDGCAYRALVRQKSPVLTEIRARAGIKQQIGR